MEDSEIEFVVAAGAQAIKLRKNAEAIERKFNVLLRIPSEENEGMIWVRVRGNITNVNSAKLYVQALCNPDMQDNLWLPDMPPCIFTALNGFWHDRIEFKFSVVIDPGFGMKSFNISGTGIQVVKAMSYLTQLQLISRQYDGNGIDGSGSEIVTFNNKIAQCSDPQESTLLTLSPPVKKELLDMINQAGREFAARNCKRKSSSDLNRKSSEHLMDQISDIDNELDIEIGATGRSRPSTSAGMISHGNHNSYNSHRQEINGEMELSDQAKFIKKSMKQIGFDPDNIETVLRKHGGEVSFDVAMKELHTMMERKLLETSESPTPEMNDDVIILSSDDDSSDNDVIIVGGHASTNTAPTNQKFPEIIEIEEWLRKNYTVTNMPKDFVLKRQMLQDFQTDFNLESFIDLANNFFNKLTQSVFERDPTYARVKSKGGGSKSGKRLICIRKRSPLEAAVSTPSRKIQNQPVTHSGGGAIKEWLNSPSQENRFKPPESAYYPPELTQHQLEVYPSSELPYSPPMGVPHQPKGKRTNKQLLTLPPTPGRPNLRHIVIDGSNVACRHGNGPKKTFSCRGIAICVQYFWARGHREITCFVPNYRKGNKGHPPTIDQEIIYKLEDQGIVKITPSREVNGRQILCYDDRYIIKLAIETDGIMVSNDQYRELRNVSPDFRRVIDNNLLLFEFVGDIFMPPDDPFGANGRSLDQMLLHPPRRAPQPHSLFPSNQRGQPNQWAAVRGAARGGQRWFPSRGPPPQRFSGPPPPRYPGPPRPMERSNPERRNIEQGLMEMFPDQQQNIRKVLHMHPNVHDLNLLVDFLLQELPC